MGLCGRGMAVAKRHRYIYLLFRPHWTLSQFIFSIWPFMGVLQWEQHLSFPPMFTRENWVEHGIICKSWEWEDSGTCWRVSQRNDEWRAGVNCYWDMRKCKMRMSFFSYCHLWRTKDQLIAQETANSSRIFHQMFLSIAAFWSSQYYTKEMDKS